MGDIEDWRAWTAAGDDAAFRRVVERHAGMVRATCRRVLGDGADADDAAQAAFVLLARRARSIRDPARIAAWLHATARAAARQHARSLRRRRHHEERAMARTDGTDGGAAAAGLDADALRPRLDEALARLREDQRAAVIAYYLEGRSQREVAESLGIAEEAAKKRLHRAVEALRAWFDRRGVIASSTAVAAALAGEAAAAPSTLVDGCVGAALQGAATPAAAAIADAVRFSHVPLRVAAAVLAVAATVIAVVRDPAGDDWEFERRLPVRGSAWCAAFAPDGGALLAGGRDGARMFDLATGAIRFDLATPGADVRACAFSPSGRLIVACADDRVARIRSAADGAVVADVACGDTSGNGWAVFSPDERRMLTGSLYDGTRLVEIAGGAEVARWPAWAAVDPPRQAFSADGARLVVPGERGAAIVDARTAATIATLGRGHCFSASFLPDGAIVAAGHDAGDDTGWVAVWDATGSVERCAWTGTGWTAPAAMVPGMLVISARAGLRLVDPGSGAELAVLAGSTADLHGAPVCSSDGGEVAATSRQGYDGALWSARDGRRLRRFAETTSFAFSPDGTRLVRTPARATGVIELWRRSPAPAAAEPPAPRGPG